MRIIAGELKSKEFNAPKGRRTHPMSDKMRGAVFSALGDIKGLSILDAFAGSGAISFEAISRGAASAVAIDSDKKAVAAIKVNLKRLNLEEKVKAVHANASGWSDNNQDRQFNLVFCDPPYDKLQISLLQKLAGHLKAGGVYVLSWPGSLGVPEFKGLQHIQTKSYGDSKSAFYRKR